MIDEGGRSIVSNVSSVSIYKPMHHSVDNSGRKIFTLNLRLPRDRINDLKKIIAFTHKRDPRTNEIVPQEKMYKIAAITETLRKKKVNKLRSSLASKNPPQEPTTIDTSKKNSISLNRHATESKGSQLGDSLHKNAQFSVCSTDMVCDNQWLFDKRRNLYYTFLGNNGNQYVSDRKLF